MSVELPSKKGAPVMFSKDELPQPDTTMDALAKLKTIYGSPTVTAGNAPGLDAGATAIIIIRRSKAKSFLNAGAAVTGYAASAAVWPRVTPLSSA